MGSGTRPGHRSAALAGGTPCEQGVSTPRPAPEAQHDALPEAGCDEMFIDKAPGKLPRRLELDRALLSANRIRTRPAGPLVVGLVLGEQGRRGHGGTVAYGRRAM